MPQEYDIGFHPETNAVKWMNPQTSPFGNAIRGGFNPLGGANYEWFAYDPFYWPTDFYSTQVAGITPSEYLWADYFGYRGIIPFSLQSVSPEPYPYETGYPYAYSP